jgi:hypothetical protein
METKMRNLDEIERGTPGVHCAWHIFIPQVLEVQSYMNSVQKYVLEPFPHNLSFKSSIASSLVNL